MSETLQPFIHWLQLHPHWISLAVFFIAFAESLAMVGIIIPGVVLLTGVGTLIGADIIPLSPTVFWAMAGAFLGDWLSYGCGRRFKTAIPKMWPFSRYPHWLDSGYRFFYRHGGKSIFIGRFVGPVRPVVPLLAGMMGMPHRQFLQAAIPSSCLWAPAYLLPGLLLGLITSEFAPKLATAFIVGLMLALGLCWLLYLLLKRLSRAIRVGFRYYCVRCWRSPWGKVAFSRLQNPHRPQDHRPLSHLILGLLSLLAFGMWTLSTHASGAESGLNQAVHHWMSSLYHPQLAFGFILLTAAGKIYVLSALAMALCAWFYLKGDRWTAWHLAGLMIAIVTLMMLFKFFGHTTRPPGLEAGLEHASYPSAHVSISVAFLGFLALILGNLLEKRHRSYLYIALSLWLGVMAFSRLYLGAHWLGDVIGGLLLGFAVLSLIAASWRRRLMKYQSLPLLAILSAVGFFCCWLAYVGVSLESSLQKYQPQTQTTWLSEHAWQQMDPLPPAMLTTRWGRPAAQADLQWAGSLEQIKQLFLAQGWRPLTWQESIQHFLAQTLSAWHRKQWPTYVYFYHDKAAVLKLYHANGADSFDILTLWPTATRLMPDAIPVWVALYQARPGQSFAERYPAMVRCCQTAVNRYLSAKPHLHG